MTEPRRFFRPLDVSKQIGGCFVAATLGAGMVAIASPDAFAQADQVTVDLSVIQDSGASAVGPSSGYGLMIPPRTNPVSELHVAPQKQVKLRAPGAPAQQARAKTMQSPAPAPMPVTMAKPAAKPAAAPAPKPVPVEKVVKAEPTPAPATATATALEPKSVPAPPPVSAPVAEMKQEPAPAPAASAAPPPPPQVAKAEEPEAPVEEASTGSSSIEIAPGQAMRIEFGETETKLPDNLKDALRKIADGVQDKPNLRLQLMAYAGASGLSASKARRLSLSRALSVRSFLMESGVRSTRIDVRALGNKTSEKPANRVDINIEER